VDVTPRRRTGMRCRFEPLRQKRTKKERKNERKNKRKKPSPGDDSRERAFLPSAGSATLATGAEMNAATTEYRYSSSRIRAADIGANPDIGAKALCDQAQRSLDLHT